MDALRTMSAEQEELLKRELSRSERVKERLELVHMITELNPLFLDPKRIRDTPNGGWTHPWKYFDSLRNYLCLTCFDLLGQAESWKDFGSWLTSGSTEPERAAILAAAEKKTLLESIKFVHDQYLAAYGVRRAFIRFINDVLPQKASDELIFSVRIRKIDTAANRELEVVEAKTKKLDFLYDVRNSFTHSLINTGSPVGGLMLNLNVPANIDGVLRMGWHPIIWEYREGFHLEYSVRDWPNALIRAVEIGLQVVKD